MGDDSTDDVIHSRACMITFSSVLTELPMEMPCVTSIQNALAGGESTQDETVSLRCH